MQIFIILAIIGLIVFGVTGSMDSYATAQQAQATIEVAQVAQVNAWGNLVVILLLALVIVCVLALVVWMVVRRSVLSHQPSAGSRPRSAISPREDTAMLPTASVEMLMQLKVLEMLERMSPPAQRPQIEEQNEPITMEWLRRQ